MRAAALMTLGQAHALLPASRLVGDAATPLHRVHSDTRSLQPGDFFAALRGERFDAHDFLPQAAAAGAAAALAEHGLQAAGLSGLEVPDSLAALQQLAAAWRAHLHMPVIAVAGSNGKTTVTQMLGSILRAAHGADGAFATQGNFNNHIGLPLMLLRLRQDDSVWHRAAALELGMNHPGEIALLARLAQPTAAVVNNAQREHQEFMASVAAVARENGQVFEALPEGGTAVFPASDTHAGLWQQMAGTRRNLRFAVRGESAANEPAARADVQAQGEWQGDAWAMQLHTPMGQVTLRLTTAGRHNLHNATAAASAALAIGTPLSAIAAGLEAFEPVAGRSRPAQARLHGQVLPMVDDSYNANPDSVRAAIELLAAMPGPRWLVLGDMGEVGTQGPAFHGEVGAYAAAQGIEQFWCAGALCAHSAQAYGRAARHFDSTEALLAALPAQAPQGLRSLLVKGSRFMRMERVVQALQHAPAAPSSPPAAKAT
jgi:UDP-N-acetylmuramoyl-tripeptide--D-alanyl-D-alanine ligase